MHISSSPQLTYPSLHRHAYNIPFNEVTTVVIQALLKLPSASSSDQYWTQLSTSLNKFIPLLKKYIRTQESQRIFLLAIEEYYHHHASAFTCTCLVKLLNWLYDEELIEEEAIVDWFTDAPSLPELIFEETLKSKRDALRKEKLLTRFMEWLETDEDDSQQEDSQDEESDED